MPNYRYHLARAKGSSMRRLYRALLPAIVRSPSPSRGSIPLEVFSYSGEQALPEQVASIRSFLHFAGQPKQFNVVSDGTYSKASIELLKRINPSVLVSQARDWLPRDLPNDIYLYLTTHPTGRQLALIMSLPTNGPALYVDSDVLFFPGAENLAELAKIPDVPAFYLADCQLAADARLFRDDSEKSNPVNTGFLLLFKKLDWSLSISRFLELDRPPTFFTNQTMTHLTMHANSAAPFDPRKYVLQLDDQFVFEDRYASDDLAMRHYVNPVRHKFWT